MITRSFIIHSILTIAALAEPAQTTVKLSAVTDKPEAVYAIGEEVTFSISGPAGTVVSCVLSKDGLHPQPAKQVTLGADGVTTLKGKLDEPGVLSLRATVGKSTALAGAAVAPMDIKPSMPVPADFDTFWSDQKAALKKVPAKATMLEVASATKGVKAFDVKVDCVGAPVSGYFGRPEGAKPKSLAAILTVHGAGVRGANLGVTSWALRHNGMLAMDINAHGIENGKPAEYYKDLETGALRNYRAMGNDDREKCYFKGMFLRVIRAIDFLTSQPDWDGKHLIVYGSSQGGFQALAAAGLDDRVSFICAGVPAGCDHTGYVVDRISGWPKLVTKDATGKVIPAAQETARYFDCVNFATRAKCSGAALTVGYIDGTCPPTSVYAAYNALSIPKSIHADPLVGHAVSAAGGEFMQKAVMDHLKASP